MPVRHATIASSVGLHARPAALFVQEVVNLDLPVTIAIGDDDPVDADSMMSVMALGAMHGDVVTLTCEDEGSEDALDQLVAFLETDHDA